jgi:hypothetical protein
MNNTHTVHEADQCGKVLVRISPQSAAPWLVAVGTSHQNDGKLTAEAAEKPRQKIAEVSSDTEAHRIAGELMKAHKLGMIDGAQDPMARTLAMAIRIFDGTIVEDY